MLIKNRHIIYSIILFLVLALGSPFTRASIVSAPKKKPHKKYDKVIEKIHKKRERIILNDSLKRVQQDSLWAIRDYKALCFYDSIKSKSKKNFITKHLQQFVLSDSNHNKKDHLDENSARYFVKYENKKIRRITIVYKDIFPESDMHTKSGKKAVRLINKSHLNTRESTIRKNIFFKEGERLSPILMANSEERVRNLPYINNATIVCTVSKEDPNTVDVLMYVQDKFSYGASMNVSSPTDGNVKVYNQNLLGLGHQLSLKYIYNTTQEKERGYEIEYDARNVFTTFADLSLKYSNAYEIHQYKAQVSKQFVSSKPQYAGELSFHKIMNSNQKTLIKEDTIEIHQRNIHFDSWVAHSFNLNGSSINSHQLILGTRYSQFKQLLLPSNNSDYNDLFPSRKQFLISTAISKRTSYRANLIYGYGVTEDIPIGRYCEAVFGYDKPEDKERLYTHLYYSQSVQLKHKSYLFFNAFIGGFWNLSQIDQAIIGGEINYFSQLYKIGRYQFRQFINFNYTKGIDRFTYEVVDLNGRQGVRDIRSNEVYGKEKMTLQLENVHYHKRAIYGFKFASYLFADMGLIDNEAKTLKDNFDYYTELGIGVRIRNEALVFNTIELRLGYFPIVPNDMSNFIYKATSTTKSNFHDFRGRKPEVLPLK